MADAENMSKDVSYTMDGTVDIKGRPVVRSKGGRWTACSFIVVYEAFERLAYFGIAPNLVIYLTNKLHQGTVSSANNVTNWIGAVMLSPILGAYIADAYLGRYWTFIFSSFIYFLGMILLTLSTSLHSLTPPPCNNSNEDCSNLTSRTQIGIFLLSLYTIALGSGGTKANVSTFGADQFDVFDPKERTLKLSFFNWWTFAIFFGNLFSSTVLVYIQDNVSWTVGYAIPTAALGFSMVVFLMGTPYYRHRLPSGSPITRIAAVLVAAARKLLVSLPAEPSELYELEAEEYAARGQRMIGYTTSLRFLDRAAVKVGAEGPWNLCPVTQVEETKQVLKLLPVFVTTIIPSSMMAQVLTLFIKQGATMDRSMGPHFTIPPGSLSCFLTIGVLVSVPVYDRWLMPLMRRYTGNPRGISFLKRIGIGEVLHIFIMLIAALTERRRLSVVRENGLENRKATVPISAFALLPQFALMGVAEMLVEVGKMEFFYDQAPEGMKSLGASFFTTTLGIGNFISSSLLSTVASVTRKGGEKGWIENNLNTSRLDYYYVFFAVLNTFNLVFFVLVAKFHVYNKETVKAEHVLQEAEPEESGSFGNAIR